MQSRALLRRAFPYLVIGIGGFALAYIVIFAFVLPSRIVPRPQPQYVPPVNPALQPIDTPMHAPADSVPLFPSQAMSRVPTAATIIAPNLVGMSLPDARTTLNRYRVRTLVQRDTSSFQPPNTVLRQSPEPGDSLAPNASVTLFVSILPPVVPSDTMPIQRGAALPPIVRADSDSTRADSARHP